MLINTNLNLKGKNIIKHLHPYLNPTILSRSRVGFRNFNKIDTRPLWSSGVYIMRCAHTLL